MEEKLSGRSPSINDKLSAPKDERGLRRAPSNNGAEPGQQFRHLERFWEIVVCSGVQAFDTFHPAPAGGQRKHRRPDSLSSPSSQHVQSIHRGKTEVENYDRECAQSGLISCFTVGLVLNNVVPFPKGLRELPGDSTIVFHNERSHLISRPSALPPCCCIDVDHEDSPISSDQLQPIGQASACFPEVSVDDRCIVRMLDMREYVGERERPASGNCVPRSFMVNRFLRLSRWRISTPRITGTSTARVSGSARVSVATPVSANAGIPPSIPAAGTVTSVARAISVARTISFAACSISPTAGAIPITVPGPRRNARREGQRCKCKECTAPVEHPLRISYA